MYVDFYKQLQYYVSGIFFFTVKVFYLLTLTQETVPQSLNEIMGYSYHSLSEGKALMSHAVMMSENVSAFCCGRDVHPASLLSDLQ